MRTEEDITNELENLKDLHYDAVGVYWKNMTPDNLIKLEQLYGQIKALEWVLKLR